MSVAFRDNAARKQDDSNQSAIREPMARVVERRELWKKNVYVTMQSMVQQRLLI